MTCPQESLMIDLQALGRQAEEIFFGKGSRVLFFSNFCLHCLFSPSNELELRHCNPPFSKGCPEQRPLSLRVNL